MSNGPIGRVVSKCVHCKASIILIKDGKNERYVGCPHAPKGTTDDLRLTTELLTHRIMLGGRNAVPAS